MKQGIIYRSEGSLFNYVGWPTVAKDENGVIYVVASGHRLGHVCPFGKNYMFKSYDNAKTWEGPIVINDTPYDDRDAGLLPLGDGKMILSWFINDIDVYTSRYERITKYADEAVVPLWKAGVELWESVPENERLCGSFLKITEDGGKTWSQPIVVPITSPHGPTKLKNGKLLYLGTEFENKQRATNTDTVSSIVAYESEDEGLTWKKLGNVPLVKNNPEIFMCEPYQIELNDGSILGLIRVHEDADSHKFCTYQSISKDDGVTWTEPVFIGEGSPPHVFRHSSGALVLTYTIRSKDFGQRARVSYDEGKTWSDEIVLCTNAVNWDSGYCSSVELDDGSIYTVYYQKADGDKYCSLMYTNWNLPE